ncbi:MAG: carboxylating nicotinate-nucleotide diphosphorylase [Spirochaetales bacterium]|nr:carboxylating nicotinate-nucleotide diphosphorylase [Spirochaetales bacterium]
MTWRNVGEIFSSGALRPLVVQFDALIKTALAEDLGRGGDLTTDLIFKASHTSQCVLKARHDGVLSGLAPALWVWASLDDTLEVALDYQDGDFLPSGSKVLEIRGRTRPILTGERTVLNLLGHLSGIATRTRRLVQMLDGTNASLCDTRKTLPGLRTLQKYAVTCGGGFNHRFGLDDCILIKDNHIAACGSLTEAVQRVRALIGHTVKIEVEVDSLEQLDEALSTGVEIVLLDNFSAQEMAQAVARRNALNRNTAEGTKSPLLEASGGVDEKTIRTLAETGVDLISMGALTHSVTNFDFGLDH